MKIKLHPLASMLLLMALGSLWLYFLMQWKHGPNEKKEDESLKAFNASMLKGRLVAKQFRGGNETIKLDNSTETFSFRPLISEDGSLFHANTDLGDSIIKQPDSPAILVKSGNKIYRYRIEQ